MDRGIMDLTIHGDLTCSANKKNSREAGLHRGWDQWNKFKYD